MDATRLVGVGASAGGVEALLELVDGLDPTSRRRCSWCCTRRRRPDGAARTSWTGGAPSTWPPPATATRCARAGCYVAPPDRHLQVEDGRVRLPAAPRRTNTGRASTSLFRSLARDAGRRATGVVLSRARSTTARPGSPRSSTTAGGHRAGPRRRAVPRRCRGPPSPGCPTRSSPGRQVGAALAEIAARRTWGGHGGRRRPCSPTRWRRAGRGARPRGGEPPGAAAGLRCPDCSGPLFEVEDGGLPRFRCRRRARLGPREPPGRAGREVERALYAALRALEGKAALLAAGGRVRPRRGPATASPSAPPVGTRRARLRGRPAPPAGRRDAPGRRSPDAAGIRRRRERPVSDDDAGLRGPPAVHQGEPRLRLHRLQALQRAAPGGAPDAAGRGERRSPTTSTASRSHPDEFTALFNTILINVTGLLPRPGGLGHLRDEVLPPILAAKTADEPRPGVVRRLRERRGGLRAGDRARRGPRHRRSSGAG